MKIVIDTNGEARAIASDDVEGLGLGDAKKRRASHVLPKNRLLRWAFRLLRDKFGETGRVAELTRRWPCLWMADMSPMGGPTVGPFRNRSAAIAWEVAWLDSHWL